MPHEDVQIRQMIMPKKRSSYNIPAINYVDMPTVERRELTVCELLRIQAAIKFSDRATDLVD